jgi:hypothetical protein
MRTEGRQAGSTEGRQPVHVLQGHTSAVQGISFSPDGNRIATAGADGTVRLWDVQTGLEVLVHKGYTGGVTSVCFSPDGSRITSGSGGTGKSGRVTVWEAGGGEQTFHLRARGHTGPLAGNVYGVGFSSDGKRVLAALEGTEVGAWDVDSGQPLLGCTDPRPGEKEAVSPDRRLLVRMVKGRPVVQPCGLREDDTFRTFRQRLDDPTRTHFWHLRLALEAQQRSDAFALAFHSKPLLLTSFLRWEHRPQDSLPYWAWRPPLSRSTSRLPGGALVAGESDLRKLVEELSHQVDAGPQAWAAWAARGWCRHLLGDADGALADLKQASDLHPDEPGLWALRGTVYLKHQREGDAAMVHKRLAAWQGLQVQVWHACEATACEAEDAKEEAAWHRKYLPDKQAGGGP